MRHEFRCAVRFDDLDAYGHVNNVTFVEYLQEARVDWAHSYATGARGSHEGAVVVHQEIDYLKPVPFRTEPLVVAVWVTRIGTSSYEVAYEVTADGVTVARAASRLVAYDLAAHGPRELTPGERSALERFLAS
ncbi:MAG TPA: thioesterase family protein [Jiangellales bacterium]|nr:thioesterase family protein [Jiangellales bacterium]